MCPRRSRHHRRLRRPPPWHPRIPPRIPPIIPPRFPPEAHRIPFPFLWQAGSPKGPVFFYPQMASTPADPCVPGVLFFFFKKPTAPRAPRPLVSILGPVGKKIPKTPRPQSPAGTTGKYVDSDPKKIPRVPGFFWNPMEYLPVASGPRLALPDLSQRSADFPKDSLPSLISLISLPPLGSLGFLGNLGILRGPWEPRGPAIGGTLGFLGEPQGTLGFSGNLGILGGPWGAGK